MWIVRLSTTKVALEFCYIVMQDINLSFRYTNKEPCRGFKSFVLLSFVMKFWKKCVFGSSNPSTRKNIENGSMEIRKKTGSKKTEKSLEISAFLVFSRSDLNRPLNMAGAGGFEPATHGFGDRYSTSWAIPLYFWLVYYTTRAGVFQYVF